MNQKNIETLEQKAERIRIIECKYDSKKSLGDVLEDFYKRAQERKLPALAR